MSVTPTLRGLLDDAEAEREKLRAELIALARHVDRDEHDNARSLALAIRRSLDPTYTDAEDEF